MANICLLITSYLGVYIFIYTDNIYVTILLYCVCNPKHVKGIAS